jgi:hypothetical protein
MFGEKSARNARVISASMPGHRSSILMLPPFEADRL